MQSPRFCHPCILLFIAFENKYFSCGSAEHCASPFTYDGHMLANTLKWCVLLRCGALIDALNLLIVYCTSLHRDHTFAYKLSERKQNMHFYFYVTQ